MNERKAKQLKKKIYGDISTRGERKYIVDHGTLVNTGKRKEYRDAKRKYNKKRGNL